MAFYVSEMRIGLAVQAVGEVGRPAVGGFGGVGRPAPSAGETREVVALTIC